MMSRQGCRDGDEFNPITVAAFLLLLVWLLLMATSCATYAAVTEAPAEFWLTAEQIVMAVVEDLWAIVGLFL